MKRFTNYAFIIHFLAGAVYFVRFIRLPSIMQRQGITSSLEDCRIITGTIPILINQGMTGFRVWIFSTMDFPAESLTIMSLPSFLLTVEISGHTILMNRDIQQISTTRLPIPCWHTMIQRLAPIPSSRSIAISSRIRFPMKRFIFQPSTASGERMI